MIQSKTVSHNELANAIRALTIDAVEKAKSGHPGMPMGMADVATVLFQQFLKFNPKDPYWADRDRFILSAGHGSMLLYALFYLTGYEDIDIDQIKRFRQFNSRTAGHPEYGYADGIETTTGPLGQGIANGVGMALAESILRQRHGDKLVNHYTYVIAGDGCLMEGISQEAISFAGHLKLNKLIILFDDNGITIDGKTSLSTSENHIERFKACQWNTIDIDGHAPEAIAKALRQAQKSDKPTLIACKTTIGYGAPKKAGTEKCHGSPLGPEEAAAAKEALGWTAAPFEIPDPILETWRQIGQRNADVYDLWKKQSSSLNTSELPQEVPQLIHDFCLQVLENPTAIATRQSSENVLKTISSHMPNLLGGSADLTGSNNTKTPEMQPITPENHQGNYIYYGIREHGMGAIMNGLALHGFIPYGGTFLAFTDYCRPAIRLSALMEQRVIYVMTHDSIGLGEDGPTHQPIEHLWSLRAIPNLLVFRPADTIETAECWLLALQHEKNPSILALTRQALPIVRNDIHENLSAKGGYILKASTEQPQVTLIATGSEVSLALEVAEDLENKRISTKVVSMPCIELFDQQPETYRQHVLEGKLRVAIEAGCTMGWHKYVEGGLIIGIDQFGASAPAKDLFPHFGFSVASIVNRIQERI